MNRLLKIIASVIVLIILIVIIAVVSIILLVDPNRFKPLIISEVKAATGRTLTIEGNLNWSFFPSISIEAGKISLSNTRAFHHSQFLSANSARAKVRLLPLLSGRIQPKTIIIDQAHIHLLVNKQGQRSWSQANTQRKQQHLSAAPHFQQQPIHRGWLMPALQISHSSISYQNQQTGQDFSLSHFSITAKQPRYNRPFTLQMSALFRDAQKHIEANTTLVSTVVYNDKGFKFANLLASGTFSSRSTQSKPLNYTLSGSLNFSSNALHLQPLNFSIGNMHGDGYLIVSDLNKLSYNGAINIKQFNLRQLLQNLSYTLNLQNANALQQAALSLVFKGDKKQLNISAFNLHVDKGHVQGSIKLDSLSQHIANMRIFAKDINIDNYLPVTTSKATSSQKITLAQKSALIQFLQPWDFSGQINAQQITVHKLLFNAIIANATAHHGYFTLYPFAANLYHGKISGSMSADFKPLSPHYKLRLNLHNLQSQPILTALANYKNISGMMNGNISLRTQGQSALHLKTHTNGEVRFHVDNAIYHGIDFSYFYKYTLAILGGKKPTVHNQKLTRLGSLSATFNVINGVADSNDLLLQSHDFSVKGNGKVNIISNTLNFLLNIKDNHGNDIPLLLKGNFYAPKISLDHHQLATIARHHAEKHLRNEFKNHLKYLGL